MCGIAGIVGRGHPMSLLERMTELLRHRGPDDSGVFAGDGILLGARRLAILDLSSAGHQPMTHGDCTVVYNGEIYNFRQLRRDLPGPFLSNSDTEVLLHLYQRDGERCVEHLQGMFAFAIWDQKRQRLFAARDRLGIKPLLYRPLDSGLAFASELKALLPLGRPAIDPTALRDFFTYKYVPTPKTIYRDIHKLPPAHTLTWDARSGDLALRRYWQPRAEIAIEREDDALGQLEELLREVVLAHTLADVPVGVFLSGGIDSTTLIANLDRPHTFTLGFDVRTHDESARARSIAHHFGAIHHEETATGVDLSEALQAMPALYDEPFGDHGAWPVYMIARRARREVTVALTGEGGDELFAGYHWYDKFPRFRSTALHRALARLLPPLSAAGRSFERRAATDLLRYSMFLGPFTPRQKQRLLAPELLYPDYDDLWYFRAHWREDLAPMKRLQWADLHTYLVDDMLTKVDRATMAVSLEARPPFVDHRLVEFALALHPQLLRQGEEGKVLLRRFLQPRVPAGHLEGRKIGFSMPVRRWVWSQPHLLREALGRLERAGILRTARRYPFNNEQAWSLLVLDRWLEASGAGL